MRLDILLQIVAFAGLDTEAAINEMRSPDVTGILNQDLADLATVGVRKTPTFFVNDKPVGPFLAASEVADVDSRKFP